jgi:hypothetical protein
MTQNGIVLSRDYEAARVNASDRHLTEDELEEHPDRSSRRASSIKRPRLQKSDLDGRG